jgi:predicted enzyme related to lactoylglutathione lyase
MIEVERVDFVAVPTRNVERAKRFYGETLGLELEKDSPAGAEYRAGQVTLGVWAPESQGMPFEPNLAGIALRVPDVAAAQAELEAAGVEFSMGTFDTGVCHMALFEDPDGNRLLLHRRYAPQT